MIEPFRIEVSDGQLDDLNRRIDATRWPQEPAGVGDHFGVPGQRVRRLADHWRHRYDWRRVEAELNALPQHLTVIDGQTIHLFHVRSEHPDAFPLLLTHGWPGSFVEYLDVIGPLSERFDLVIPSIPGWGFSGPTDEPGWDIERVARAWAELMRRLGHDRYGVQGGDWGTPISLAVATIDADHVAAVHLHYLPTPPPPDGGPELSADDAERLADLRRYQAAQPGVRVLNGTRPQTAAYALVDSPVGLLAWLVDVIDQWSDPAGLIDDDRLLTNVMVYWLSATAGSAPRIHRDSPGPATWRPTQPLGVLTTPHDLTRPIRPYAEARFDVRRWTELGGGGHFPALEVPDLFAADVTAFFTPFAQG